jgi:hypothetical protein
MRRRRRGYRPATTDPMNCADAGDRLIDIVGKSITLSANHPCVTAVTR